MIMSCLHASKIRTMDDSTRFLVRISLLDLVEEWEDDLEAAA